jgi:hypothetical protein
MSAKQQAIVTALGRNRGELDAALLARLLASASATKV